MEVKNSPDNIQEDIKDILNIVQLLKVIYQFPVNIEILSKYELNNQLQFVTYCSIIQLKAVFDIIGGGNENEEKDNFNIGYGSRLNRVRRQ